MAAKLSVRITFDGGEEMKKTLKELGLAGEKSFKQISDGASSVKSAFAGIGDAIKTVGKGFLVLGGAATGLGAAIIGVAKSSADAADEAGKTAQKVGLTADAYQRLAYAAKTADIETGTLQTGLRTFSKNLIEAVKGNKELATTFKTLGIGLTVEKPLSRATRKFMAFAGELHKAERVATTADVALLRLADIFKAAPDGPAKTALAMQLFGKAGAELIPLLNQGSKEIQQLMARAGELGLVFSDQAIAQSDKFGDTLDELLGAITGVKNAIGQAFIPELTRLFQLATDFIVKNRAQIVAWVERGWNVLVRIIKDVIALFQGRDEEVVNTWLITARNNLQLVLDAALAVAGAVNSIAQAFKHLNEEKKNAFVNLPKRPDGVVPRFAAGGHIRGPGTGTSDSILARLSNGEFVVRRAVVDSLGLPFMNALNAGMVPAFADGGAAGGRPVNVNIGGESFALSGGDGVVTKLSRFARSQSLRRPGRSPSWVSRR